MNGGEGLTPLPLRYGSLDNGYWDQLMDDASGPHGPVWSISLHKFRERACYADGDRGRTGAQAFDHFVDIDLIDSVGGELVLDGPIIQTRRGEPWDRLVVLSLPSAGALVEMMSHPTATCRHEHKDAGVLRSIQLIGTQLAQPVADIVTAPDDDAVINALFWRYNDPDAPEKFLAATPGLARSVGASREAWFEVDGTLIHDGNDWDEVFFARYPSIEAYEALNAHPTWRAASDRLQSDAKNCYEMLMAPTINRLAHSLH